jgi:dihydrofolate synthase/folylpolyglutamate synthase
VAAVRHLKEFEVSQENILNGLFQVVKNTHLKGRWQVLQETPRVICDTAHNKEGLSLVLEQLQKERYKKVHIVLGVVADKNLEDILPLFPRNARYYFCKPNVPRGMSVEDLYDISIKFDLIGKKFSSVAKAYKEALLNANQEDIIYVGGSTFVVAEII